MREYEFRLNIINRKKSTSFKLTCFVVFYFQITLRGRNIPYLQERYFCNFGREPVYRQQVTGIQRENSAKNSPLLIQCVTPPRSLIPRFPPEEGSTELFFFLPCFGEIDHFFVLMVSILQTWSVNEKHY